MRKVSNTMLAVIAAIQSGAHTRRTPRYYKEYAILSGPYPLYVEEKVSARNSVNGARLVEPESSYISSSANAEINVAGIKIFAPIEETYVHDYVKAGASSVFNLRLAPVDVLSPTTDTASAEVSIFGSFRLANVVINKGVEDRVLATNKINNLMLG